jgi:hypothetical protein
MLTRYTRKRAPVFHVSGGVVYVTQPECGTHRPLGLQEDFGEHGQFVVKSAKDTFGLLDHTTALGETVTVIIFANRRCQVSNGRWEYEDSRCAKAEKPRGVFWSLRIALGF